MKFNRKLIAFVISLITIANFSIVGSIPTFAHEAILDVTYDNCVVDANNSDGIDEMWYLLDSGTARHHISHEIDTIRYFFEETNTTNGCTWIPAGESETVAEEIKNAYINSLKKWDNIYFYSYNDDGTITKNKLINIVEGTETTWNVLIRPNTQMNSVATTGAVINSETNVSGTTPHSHYSKWIMNVNINYFFQNSPITRLTSEDINWAKENVGAHEFGHVLGLRDIDKENVCNSTLNHDHHLEVLMGYGGNSLSDRASAITYKDIAGVAITRGFHTDNDHKWLNMGQQSDGTYKLVCSICNGVKTVSASELNEYSCSTYGACEGDHDNLLYGNMMAVASYGDQDYYKCKYCRYVASFSKIVDQNYEKTPFSNDLHKCENNVSGLRYTFYEEHTFVDNVCTECGYVHTHTYSSYVYHNNTSHKRTCSCGHVETQAHYIYASDIVNGRYVTCLGCGELLDLQYDIANSIMSNITKVSVNGSYIRSDGIVVLVDEDIEAYLAGTLQFYPPADLPVTQ